MPYPKIRSSKDQANKFEGNTIQVAVGRGRNIYHVHERLICNSSSFFMTAMSCGWKESLERIIEMPDDEPKVFEIYVHWLYSGTLPVHCQDSKFYYGSDNGDEDSEEDSSEDLSDAPTHNSSERSTEDSDKNMEADSADDDNDDDGLDEDFQNHLADYLRERASEDSGKDTSTEDVAADDDSGSSIGDSQDSADLSVDDEYLTLVKTYVLGDKIIDPLFQNAAIDAIIEKSCSDDQDNQHGVNMYPGADAIDYAYKNTHSAALIRRLLVDLYVRHGDQTWIGKSSWEASDMVPQAFLWDLSSKLYAAREAELDEFNPSDYHISC